jgi:hypothetical protein
MEREDARAGLERSAGVDRAHGRIPVPEREGECPGERAERLVERRRGVDRAAVGEQLGARADAGHERADQHRVALALDIDRPDLDVARLDEPQGARSHAAALPRATTGKPFVSGARRERPAP